MFERVTSLLRSTVFRSQGVAICFTSTDNEVTKLRADPKKSLLDSLLDEGLNLPYSCKAGACQSCKLQCDDTTSLPTEAQSGLSNTEKQLGYFLPCVCFPSEKLSVKATDTVKPIVETEVVDVTLISEDVLVLKLTAPFPYRAGQFCNLYRDDTAFRSYSVASASNESVLEFHIKVVEDGYFSSWAKQNLHVGTKLNIQGPYGTCVHVESKSDDCKNILLSGTGTGLAPLLGVIRDILASPTQQELHLVLGAKSSKNFYMQDALANLAAEHKSLTISWLSSETPEAEHSWAEQADIYQFVKGHYPDLTGFKVYLCGAESFVHKMKKTCYLNNASLSNILSDAFVPQQ